MNLRQVFEQAAEEAQRAHACAECKYIRDREYGNPRCEAFARLCASVRREYELRCPAYVKQPSPVVVKPVGLIRWLWRLFW
jgi:hypothetical protein